ncbi:MAG: hypothetical protein ACK5GN_07735 [Pseudomonadota bacterium]|jgi:hypothetical protein
MISSIDPANSGATLINQSNTTTINASSPLASTQTTQTSLLPIPTQGSTETITERLQNLMTMIQSLMASISSLFSSGSNSGTPNGPNMGSSGRFDFLRPVDQEPVTIIPPTPKSPGGTVNPGNSNIRDEDAGEVKNPETKPPTSSKKIAKGSALKKSNGEFLWKPKSDKDGKLAILLPKELTGKVKGVQILSPDATKVLGRGKEFGVGNGEREHFRFTKAGGEYPDGSIVVITLENGSKRYVAIKETADRFTR